MNHFNIANSIVYDIGDYTEIILSKNIDKNFMSHENFLKEFRTITFKLPRRYGNTTIAKKLKIYIETKNLNYQCFLTDKTSKLDNLNGIIIIDCEISMQEKLKKIYKNRNVSLIIIIG